MNGLAWLIGLTGLTGMTGLTGLKGLTEVTGLTDRLIIKAIVQFYRNGRQQQHNKSDL